MMLIAIDHGNKLIKTKNNNFVSGLSKFDTKPPFGDKILEFNGLFYCLSSKRMFYMKDKTVDDNFFILTLFAIAKEIDSRNMYTRDKYIDVKLVVGLPPSHFSKLHKKFEEYFLNRGILKFSVNSKVYQIEISKVDSFPQSYAAFISKYNDFKNFNKAIILDIGGYTADYLVIRKGIPDLELCDSLDNGITILYNNIIKRVSSETEVLLEENDIDSIILRKPHEFNSNIIKIIDDETNKFVNNLFGDLAERKIKTKQDYLILAGGGSLLLKEYILKNELTNKTVIIDDIYANVNGYEILNRINNSVATS